MARYDSPWNPVLQKWQVELNPLTLLEMGTGADETSVRIMRYVHLWGTYFVAHDIDHPEVRLAIIRQEGLAISAAREMGECCGEFAVRE